MKNSVIKDLSTPELLEKIQEERAQYQKMKMNHAISTMENPMKITYTRKTIARLETEYRRRQLEELKSK